jgi:hypothetical protein
VSNRREEVYNTTLAQLLSQRGAANCEAEQRFTGDAPDVLLEWFGLTTVIEAKYDLPGSASQLTTQVEERLRGGFGTLGIALLYPFDLKSRKGDVADALETAPLRVQLNAIGRKAGEWYEAAGIEGLVGVLDNARTSLISDDELAVSVRLLSNAVDVLARSLAAQPGHVPQVARLVTAIEATSKAKVSTEEASDACRVGALALITALMLQLVLSANDPAVPKIAASSPAQRRRGLLAEWRSILDHDYRAAFEIAYQILDMYGDTDPQLGVALGAAILDAESIVEKGVFGRHDPVGRIYHSLLSQQKFLATYYTSVPAATLLAALATEPDKWPQVDWAAPPERFGFRFADPACGTGTLLAATLAAVRRHYASARRRDALDVNASALGRRLVEDNVYGLDILAYAVQVCASTLLLSTPGTTVSRSHLTQLPFGGDAGHLGSLDLLFGDAQGVLFGAWGDNITPDGVVSSRSPLDMPEVDLVIMNPPFTRTQGGSRLLGSLTPAEWPTARRELDRVAALPDMLGRVVAGLGALFVPLADRMLRPGGRMAFVLPKTMLTGTQWDLTRELLATRYQVEMVVSSHEAGRWNFSDSTDLAEILLIARKLSPGESRERHATTWVQLTRNPDNAIDALGVATSLKNMSTPGPHGEPIVLGRTLFHNFGQAFSRPAPTSSVPWRHATFASGELDLLGTSMRNLGPIEMPATSTRIPVPLTLLSSIASIGPDRARLHDAFISSSVRTGFPCLWGHDSSGANSLTVEPNRWLAPSSRREADHAARYAASLWVGAGPLLVAERLWLPTYAAAAVVASQPLLSNVMWPVRLNNAQPGDYELLTMWLNSTLGLVAWIGAAEETRGPWLSMKKNKLSNFPVLNVSRLDERSRVELLECWERVRNSPLMPIARLLDDPIRGEIDQRVAKVLNIPLRTLEAVRQIFGSEPRLLRAESKGRSRTDGEPDVDGPNLFS